MKKKNLKFLAVLFCLIPSLVLAKEIEVQAPPKVPVLKKAERSKAAAKKAPVAKKAPSKALPKKGAVAKKAPLTKKAIPLRDKAAAVKKEPVKEKTLRLEKAAQKKADVDQKEEKPLATEPTLEFEKVPAPEPEPKTDSPKTPRKISAKSLPNIFALPDSLKKNFDLWRKIYSFYDSHQVVFYDMVNPYAIYDVLDLPKVPGEISSPRYRDQVQKRSQEIAKTIELLQGPARPKNLSQFEEQIDSVIKKNDLRDVADLNKRFRGQNGLKSQFALGLMMSGRYADEVKRLLKARGLPEELVAIVFVESLWNLSANSHAGASGPWGIVRETAIRSGIHVNRFTDERLDPLLATMAAAEFLSKAKGGLQEWPLAITAYNYGYAGMLRASSALATSNIEKIIAEHSSPIFGYASKNYYTEFLAALEVYSNHEIYFPDLLLEKPWDYELVQILRPIMVSDLFSSGAISKIELAYYNPGLTRYTINSEEVIPPEYTLRVPKAKAKLFYDSLKKIPTARREQAMWKISTKYQARGNESINYIAQKHGIIADLLANRLNQPLHYKPKGAINIRSYTYAFSQLKKVVESIFSPSSSSEVARKP